MFRSLLFSIAIATLGVVVAAPAFAAFGDITLVGQTSLSGSTSICDVWGWVDPATDTEYAIVGNWFAPERIWIVDLSDPSLPTEVAYIDGASGFDVKAWDRYIYSCDGNASGNDSHIIDLQNPLAPVLLDATFRSAHNIAISSTGYMFLEVSGFSIWDLNGDPEMPDSLWHSGTANGHDATPVGNHFVVDFGGYDDFTKLWDYTNPANPQIVAEIVNPAINYPHSGDLSPDGEYLYICDELAIHPDPDIWVYDVVPGDSPTFVTTVSDTGSTVHNLYMIGGLAFVSHYNAGFKTLDVRNPASPIVADAYDTNVLTGEGYDGAFGVYPYLPSGLILVSDWDNGLFVFQVEGHEPVATAAGDTPVPGAQHTLHQNYPNPFNPATTIAYELTSATTVRLRVFDVRGRAVRTLVDRFQTAGPQQVSWDGTDDAGVRVASGVYYYRLEAGATTETRRMVLLK